ncbi:MAG: hypothetical protein ACLSVD_02695 [Eggerthellaceae bacterium]
MQPRRTAGHRRLHADETHALLQGSRLDQSPLSSEGHTPAHIIVGTFLFSYAFMVSLSFAGLEHFSSRSRPSSSSSLLAGQRAHALLQTAHRPVAAQRRRAHRRDRHAVGIVPDLNPVVTFDLALIGILLFLAYAVVLLCAITEKTDAHAYRHSRRSC